MSWASHCRRREERLISWKVRGAISATLLVTVIALIFANQYLYLLTAALLLAAGITWMAMRYTMQKRQAHGLYYGTLARSLAPVYAFSILFLVLVVQPWLLYNEATWLRKDTISLGYLGNPREISAGCISIETKVAERLSGLVLTAMDGRGGR